MASAVRQSRALFHEAQATYDSAQRDAERQTRSAFRGIVSGIQRIGAAHRAVDSGHGAVEASRRNVEFGTGTEFDLLNAQNNYYTAVRAYSQSRYDYLTNVLTLKQQAGRLSEHDLICHRRSAHREGHMTHRASSLIMRLLPKEPVMLRDTTGRIA